jgi:DNA mismatch repair protein MutS
MTVTPMMQQYQEAKRQNPGMLLLFRMGDFFELFDDDAHVASRILGLTLTSRDKTVPMAGFPHHQLEPYLRKLLEAGQRVAVCDQVEDASQAKGLVKREVVRVVTPGTLTEDDLLDPRQTNYLLAMVPSGAQVGLAWVELSTGLFQAADVTEAQLADEASRLAPSEFLLAEAVFDRFSPSLALALPAATATRRPDWTFDPTTSLEVLTKHFGVRTLEGFGFQDDQPCLRAAGGLLTYLQETLKASLAHLDRLEPYQSSERLLLDGVTRRSLELTRTLRDHERAGSLLAILDRTTTAMGARLLQEWIVGPLTRRVAIEARLDAVAELREAASLRAVVRELLAGAFDLQRLTARVSTARASPRDLAAVARTLALLPKLKAKLAARKATLLQDLESRLDLCVELRTSLEAALVETPPLNPKEGGIIREGYDLTLDEIRGIARGGKEWIARFQSDEITRTGIASLKVGFNRVFGYYIEITHAHAAKIPGDYQRKQTLKNAERYITPELKEYEEKVLSAEDKIFEREYEIFVRLREATAAQTPRLLHTGEVLATLDVLASLAELAATRPYCRPDLVDEPVLLVRDGRHPVLDQLLPAGTFVPNDLVVGPDDGMIVLITGPNMAGKSIFIRQAALLTLMAQMGSFVPARTATIGLVDRIFTRVGASDELSRAQSTFMVEMTEAANILNNATGRSLVILDEIGRGTSTYDGVSLAWAITEYLHDQTGCRALFATHYHELAQLAEKLPRLRNYCALVQEHKDEVVFVHKVAPGNADKSYGIHVARLAGLPEPILERAREVLHQLETHHDLEVTARPMKRRPKLRAPERLLFAEMEEKETRNDRGNDER